ncbi:sedoheptulokinase [Tachysurus ichikawai]
MTCSSAKYVLGIDLGTTSVKVVLFDTRLKTVTDCCSLQTNCDVMDETRGHVKEQDPMRIITTLDQCMRSLPKEKLHDVICIGASGQMHGVLFWKSNTETPIYPTQRHAHLPHSKALPFTPLKDTPIYPTQRRAHLPH